MSAVLAVKRCGSIIAIIAAFYALSFDSCRVDRLAREACGICIWASANHFSAFGKQPTYSILQTVESQEKKQRYPRLSLGGMPAGKYRLGKDLDLAPAGSVKSEATVRLHGQDALFAPVNTSSPSKLKKFIFAAKFVIVTIFVLALLALISLFILESGDPFPEENFGCGCVLVLGVIAFIVVFIL